MGETRVALSRQLIREPAAESPREGARSAAKEKRGRNIAVLLDNVRSAWNVGSILRSADGFGFRHAYLCGITPTADNESVTKTALGAEDSVPWSYHKDAVKLVKGLKAEGWQIFALEEDKRSLPISQLANYKVTNYQPPDSQLATSSVLIVGSEVTGVDPELLELSDAIFYIPMRGEKKSFNVAIAFSLAAYTLNTER